MIQINKLITIGFNFILSKNKIKKIRQYLITYSLNKRYSKFVLRTIFSRVERYRSVGYNKEKPIIIFSAAKDKIETGDKPYNGGVKLENLWVAILKKHGYQAYIATHEGNYSKWLINHQPHISINQVMKLKNKGVAVRFVTPWLQATEFINIAEKIYYFDAEIAFTSQGHKSILDELLKKNKISKIGTHSKTQVGWYLHNYNISPYYINEWSDINYWKEDSKKRIPNRVGYMVESEYTEEEIRDIKNICERKGVEIELLMIKGDEKTIIKNMQSCDIYLGMNQGKDYIWGEGCPRSQHEAMHTGCVVVSYDVIGNREYLFNGITGYLIKNKRSDLMGNKLADILKNPIEKEKIRTQSKRYINEIFSENGKIENIFNFLDLENEKLLIENTEELTALMGPRVYLTDPEVRTLAEYSQKSNGSILEIGSAYGASTSVLLAHSNIETQVISVDPFVKDSNGTLFASYKDCKKNVISVLNKLGLNSKVHNWKLIKEYSFNLAKKWNTKLGMIFIDGNHKYKAVKQDYEDWLPFVKKDGYILIHDSCKENTTSDKEYEHGWAGPSTLAKQMINDDRVRYLGKSSSITIWTKK